MKKESAAFLLGYLRSQKGEIERILEKIKGVEPEGEEWSVYLGYQLYSLYCALEDLFKEIAATFESLIDDMSKHHTELLKRMTIEIPRIRPAVLSKESFTLLNELRSFSHFFIHSYNIELDEERLRSLKARILRGFDRIRSDIETFEAFLEGLVAT